MNTPRKSKMFWAVTDSHGVQFVTGYECPNPGQWWVPELGYSMTEGHHLFDTQKGATIKALSEIQEQRTKLNEQEAELLR